MMHMATTHNFRFHLGFTVISIAISSLKFHFSYRS